MAVDLSQTSLIAGLVTVANGALEVVKHYLLKSKTEPDYRFPEMRRRIESIEEWKRAQQERDIPYKVSILRREARRHGWNLAGDSEHQ